MDNTLQMYAKNSKPLALNHKDNGHKMQHATLLSSLVIGSGWMGSFTAICTAFWPLIWTWGNGHWNKAESAGSTIQTWYSVPGILRALTRVLPLQHVRSSLEDKCFIRLWLQAVCHRLLQNNICKASLSMFIFLAIEEIIIVLKLSRLLLFLADPDNMCTF